MMLAAAIALSIPLVARADRPSPPIQSLLLESATPAEQRSRLLAHARKVASTDRLVAGEAYQLRGQSFERAGMRDSAIASFRLATVLRGEDADRLTLVDALLRRRGPGDVDSAIAALDWGRRQAGVAAERIAYESRYGWAQFFAGRPDTARALLMPFEETLSRDLEWRYRLARVNLSASDPRRAFALLLPLAVLSRRQDQEVMKMVQEISVTTGFGRQLDDEIDRRIAERDAGERAATQRMNAHRISIRAHDDFTLGGVFAAAAGDRRRTPAITLVAPGDTIADYDSLTIALARSGYAALLLDVRGSGGSVAPSCPLADTWKGREDLLHTRVARDVREALRALALETPIDTSRYVVIGVGATASIAVEAADLDSRVAAIVLISPRPTPLEQGPMRARIRRLARPIFFQVGPEDFEYGDVTDALYQAGNRSASRVAEAKVNGHGPAQFHDEPAVGARLTRWLSETLSSGRPKSRPSSPPGAPSRPPTTSAKGNARPPE
jgi:dienelactone hydrolase